ncbi:MAG: hypothetical protein AAF705_11395 [Bacteroidota bacterium]
MKLEIQVIIPNRLYHALPEGYKSIDELEGAVFDLIEEAWEDFGVNWALGEPPFIYRRKFDPNIYSEHATFERQVPVILFIDAENEIILDALYGNKLNIATLREVLQFWGLTNFDPNTGEYLSPRGPIGTGNTIRTGNVFKSLPSIFKNENGAGFIPGPGYGVKLPSWVWILVGLVAVKTLKKD